MAVIKLTRPNNAGGGTIWVNTAHIVCFRERKSDNRTIGSVLWLTNDKEVEITLSPDDLTSVIGIMTQKDTT